MSHVAICDALNSKCHNYFVTQILPCTVALVLLDLAQLERVPVVLDGHRIVVGVGQVEEVPLMLVPEVHQFHI